MNEFPSDRESWYHDKKIILSGGNFYESEFR